VHLPRSHRAAVAVLAIAALTLVGCSTDDGADGEPLDDASGPATASAPEEPVEGEDLIDGDDPDAAEDPDPPTDGDAELTDLAEALGSITPGAGQVSYRLEGEVATEEIDRFVIVQDPPAAATIISGASGELRLIQRSEGSFTCVEAEDEWQCLDLGEQDLDGMTEGLTPPVPTLEDFEALELGQRPTVTRPTIVGREAVCLAFSGPEVDELDVAEVCFDRDSGMLLRSSGTSPTGSFMLEAESFSDPDPSLFELPAPPVDLGELGGP
jgi:hypothetical protein